MVCMSEKLELNIIGFNRLTNWSVPFDQSQAWFPRIVLNKTSAVLLAFNTNLLLDRERSYVVLSSGYVIHITA